jgi:hypothetical protein
MMKSVLFYSVISLFFLPHRSLASGYQPHIVGLTPVQDTIPPSERFDEPLSGSGVQEKSQRSLFSQPASDRKVIPVRTIETDTTFRSLHKIPEGYTGFKIELMSTSIPLPADHDLFFQHGNIALEEISEDQFAYLIGHFEAAEKAESFRSAFLEGRYPESKVVGYIEGQRQSATAPKGE